MRDDHRRAAALSGCGFCPIRVIWPPSGGLTAQTAFGIGGTARRRRLSILHYVGERRPASKAQAPQDHLAARKLLTVVARCRRSRVR